MPHRNIWNFDLGELVLGVFMDSNLLTSFARMHDSVEAYVEIASSR